VVVAGVDLSRGRGARVPPRIGSGSGDCPVTSAGCGVAHGQLRRAVPTPGPVGYRRRLRVCSSRWPSFDIVSKPSWPEIDNALNQAQKEIAQRFDFKDNRQPRWKKNSEGNQHRGVDRRPRARRVQCLAGQELVKRKVLASVLGHWEKWSVDRRATAKQLVKGQRRRPGRSGALKS